MVARNISLILLYLLGVMGFYSTINFFYRWIRYGENQLIELYRFPSEEELNAMRLRHQAKVVLSRVVKQLIATWIISFVMFAMFAVVLDSMLWLNRELGLNLAFLSGWYGPNMEILKY